MMVAYRNYGGGTYHMSTGAAKDPKYMNPNDAATKFTHRILIEDDTLALNDDLRAWCRSNILSDYHWDDIYFLGRPDSKIYRLFSFAKPADAMAFKLTFG